MSEELVLVEVDGPVATVTLNRPDARNALSRALRKEIFTTMRGLDDRDDLAAIVLTGADPAFCAGVDLKELASGVPLDGDAESAAEAISQGPFPAMATPVIGAVNGVAITGGVELAPAGGFLIASERARFAD